MAETVREFLEWLKRKGVVIKKADKQTQGKTVCRAWREVGNVIYLVTIEYVDMDDPIDSVMTEEFKNGVLERLRLKDS